MNLALALVRASSTPIGDVVLRIGGASRGADEMVEIAQAHGKAGFASSPRCPTRVR